MMDLEVCRGQIPVGQGCFSYGEITIDGVTPKKNFIYVHDCGGQIDLIKIAIDDCNLPPGEIGALFISHFDEDHVEGIKYLLSKRKVITAYIPLLDESSRTIILAGCASKGILSNDLQKFIIDPVSWLKTTGIRTVFEVDPNQRPNMNANDIEDDEIISTSGDDGAELRVSRKASGINISARVKGKTTEIWKIKTFSYVERDKDFLKKLRKHFTLPRLTNKTVRNWLLENANPKAIKDFFIENDQADHNRVSLCIYSAPSVTARRRRYCCYGAQRCRSYVLESRGSGWLHTADFPFRTKMCKDKFKKYFHNELVDVTCFMLSHHGSNLDFQVDILDWMPNLAVGLIPVGSALQYDHPSAEAIRQLHIRRIVPVLVMDKTDDLFLMHEYYEF